MALASLLVSRLASLSPAMHSPSVDSGDESASIASSQGTCSASVSSASTPASLDSRSCVSESPISSIPPELPSVSGESLRHNEHLAVLLPKSLWKPDSQATRCDIFLCRKRFSLFERRHHCRKCGGVFCADCSMKATTLLDTSHLEFFHPPRDVPISAYDSPTSPVVLSRVCDDCYDQINGHKRASSASLAERSKPIAVSRETDSGASSLVGSLRTPPDVVSPLGRPFVRRAYTSPRIPSSPLRTTASPPPCSVHIPEALGEALGELEHYPLRHASAICKANGGGRWEPKPVVQYVGRRIPGAKAEYEIELEREEEEKRIRRANPVIRDGDIQLRAPRPFEPRSPAGPVQFSTF